MNVSHVLENQWSGNSFANVF